MTESTVSAKAKEKARRKRDESMAKSYCLLWSLALLSSSACAPRRARDVPGEERLG